MRCRCRIRNYSLRISVSWRMVSLVQVAREVHHDVWGRGDFCGWRPDALSPLSVRSGDPDRSRPRVLRSSGEAPHLAGAPAPAPSSSSSCLRHGPLVLRLAWASPDRRDGGPKSRRRPLALAAPRRPDQRRGHARRALERGHGTRALRRTRAVLRARKLTRPTRLRAFPERAGRGRAPSPVAVV